MSTKAETDTTTLDTVKLGVALIILIAALVAFYYYAEVSKLARVVGLIAAVGVAAAIALQTDKGRTTASFVKESQTEVRKVVWPTRQETVQTTLVVMVVVVIIAIFLWILDMALGGIVSMAMGQRG
ncbi:MAG: preprotein translocase subunit SecE [Gammaproteobacteria bacterium]|jgi:preprotein translocase subunit SecE|nr:preprotein translocase subunit SecE [Gammaproteobacteria bacterium]|tara:strand:- start:305 stop:682 length:378 start_codon:yes stop_codon:yes gene_type:complete